MADKQLFVEKLKRNNSAIRNDRAEMIAEDAEMSFRQRIEELQKAQRRMNIQLNSLLDLSPQNALSLSATHTEFESKDFVSKNEEILSQMETNKILIRILKERYTELFGDLPAGI